MRMVLLLLCLEGVAAFAQIGSSEMRTVDPQLDWTLGVQRSQPTITASVQGSRDGRVSLVDTDSDLGLQREGNPFGALLEYKTQGHGFRLAYDSFRLQGEKALPRDISLNGTPNASGSVLRSTAKLTILEALYTYKLFQQPDAWVGLDLGAQFLKTNLTAANLTAQSPTQTAAPSLTVPQIGISGWSSAAGGLLESRMYYHYLVYRGVTATRYGLDGRAYLYPHFGLRTFYEVSKIKVPAGSIQGDLDLRMDAKSFGLGLVVRF